MGPCMVKRPILQDSLYTRVEKLIQRDDIINFETISKTEEFEKGFNGLTQGYFKIDQLIFDPLSLAAYFDSFECFKCIHSLLKYSHSKTDTLLNEQNSCLLDIICTRGSKNLIEYFIPFAKTNCIDSLLIEKTESLSFTLDEPKILKKIPSSYTPIQKACEQGNINAISCVYKYFKDKPEIPYQLDLEYQDENNGENCALISCRKANYMMIKYLHSFCHCNFAIINKQGENALQVLSASNKKKQVKDFHECFVYLVNVVSVDILYNYEETLLLINCYKTITFLEKKLSDKGIQLDKSEVEDRYKIIRIDQRKSIVEEKIDSFQGKNLDFCTLYEKIMEKDEDELSCINTENRSGTPFTSIIGNIP